MNKQAPTQNLNAQSSNTQTPPTPLRCLLGALISGTIAFALYSLTISIVHTFAAKPIQSDSRLALSIGAAVRTLVVGMSALGTGIFSIVTLGLVALAIQLLLRGNRE
jgi:hypothetical protein